MRVSLFFLNSHILQEVELICERVAILNRGELQYCGAVSEIGEFVRSSSGAEDKIYIYVDVEEGVAKKLQESLGRPILKENRLAKVEVPSQVEVDEVVDFFRQHNVSIVEIKRHETTLESAFLQIVGRGNTGASKTARTLNQRSLS